MKLRLLLVVFALVVAACGAVDEGDGEASGTTQPGDTPTSTTEAADHDPDAVFSWFASVDPSSFDPDKITNSAFMTHLFPIYDTLIFQNSELQPEPMLAESWDISEDGQMMELTLIEGWSFHDGTPFDAEAVRANLERSKTLPGSVNADALEIITEIEVVDDRTVRLHTDGPAVPLLSILTGSSGAMMSPAVFDDPSQDVMPTGGSGAFRVVEYVSGDRTVYEPVPDYWDPDAVKVGGIVIRVGGDEVKLNSVLTGEVSSTFIRPAQVDVARNDPNVVLIEKPTTNTYNIRLNTSRSEFGDVRVRQALNHAINRDAIEVLMNGFCTPGVQVFPRTYWAGNPDLGPDRYPYDPERARELLADAGLADGFSFELQPLNLPIYVQIAEAIQQDLAEVGIEITIVPYELSVLNENFAINKTADAILVEQRGEPDPSVTTAAYYLPDGFWNPGGTSDDRLTELHDEALSYADPEERGPIYHEMMEIAAELAWPNINLCDLTTLVIHGPEVQGLEVWADTTRQFRGVSIAAD